ncbi:hypothetical protein ACFV6F_11725, partial [Kitasatospora phosalacinea]
PYCVVRGTTPVSATLRDPGAPDPGRVAGPRPERRSYGSFASFADPDGDAFVLQEVTARRPGRVGHVVYRCAAEVEAALRGAALARGVHEAELGRPDPDRPAWYAAHTARAAGLGS